jgi:HEAT repeat protein
LNHRTAPQTSRPGSEITNQTIDRALVSEHPELRLEAALLMGEQGRQVLREIALDSALHDSLRVRAVEQLTRASWAETTIPVLEQLLDCGVARVLRAAVVGLGRYRHQPAVARLMALAESEVETVRLVAEALGRIGDQMAEPTLIDLLGHRDRQVVTAAARALGSAGTILAVVPLQELARRSRKIAGVAEESVRRIQGRVTGAEKGQLSLAGCTEAEGGLSQAGDAAGGDVSLVSRELPATACS